MVLWAVTGVALACVGVFPVHRFLIAHNISALATLVLFVAAAVLTTVVIPGRPTPLILTSAVIGVLIIIAVVLCDPFRLYSVTVLEAVVIGLGMLWIITLVRILAVLTPVASRPSARPKLLAS